VGQRLGNTTLPHESQVPSVAIPEHLVFAFEEWIGELISRRATAQIAGGSRRGSQGRPYAGCVCGRVADSGIDAELAAGAADWLQPQWPTHPEAEAAGDVERLAAVTRELLELRDHALAVAANNTNIARVVTVDPGLRDVLRSQTLLVLDFNHEPFEDVCDLEPAALLATASILRDAITVLDTIGWLATEQGRDD
jgi:hypothetical protein